MKCDPNFSTSRANNVKDNRYFELKMFFDQNCLHAMFDSVLWSTYFPFPRTIVPVQINLTFCGEILPTMIPHLSSIAYQWKHLKDIPLYVKLLHQRPD